MKALLHDDDVALYFGASQEERHAAMVNANVVGRSLVDNALAAIASGVVVESDDEDAGAPLRFRLVIGVDHEDKSIKQRKFLHGVVFKQISEQAISGGKRYVIAMWKEFYRREFLGFRWERYALPGHKKATPHRVRISTEDLIVKAYSLHIDRVIAHAVTELNVVFEFDPVERDGVRYVKKVRRKAVATREEATA